MINNKYQVLSDFFSSYFHPYWIEDYETVENAIDEYARDEDTHTLEITITELHEIIDKAYTESDLKQILVELGCYYNVSYDYNKTVDWLISIKKQLLQLLQSKGTSGSII